MIERTHSHFHIVDPYNLDLILQNAAKTKQQDKSLSIIYSKPISPILNNGHEDLLRQAAEFRFSMLYSLRMILYYVSVARVQVKYRHLMLPSLERRFRDIIPMIIGQFLNQKLKSRSWSLFRQQWMPIHQYIIVAISLLRDYCFYMYPFIFFGDIS